MNITSYSELTWILMKHIPKAHASHLRGELKSTTSWRGSKPFFFFSENHTERSANVTYTDTVDVYQDNWICPGIPPNYKEAYLKRYSLSFNKPVVIINNKYIMEWGRSPSNYISLNLLQKMVEFLNARYTIVYIRSVTTEVGYWNDNQPSYEFGDYDLLAEYPNVVQFRNLLKNYPNIEYNDMQLAVHSVSDKFISVAGGNAVLSSYFGGENIIWRNPNENRSNGRVLWHSNSHLSQLSGASIIGYNNEEEMIDYIEKNW